MPTASFPVQEDLKSHSVAVVYRLPGSKEITGRSSNSQDIVLEVRPNEDILLKSAMTALTRGPVVIVVAHRYQRNKSTTSFFRVRCASRMVFAEAPTTVAVASSDALFHSRLHLQFTACAVFFCFERQ